MILVCFLCNHHFIWNTWIQIKTSHPKWYKWLHIHTTRATVNLDGDSFTRSIFRIWEQMNQQVCHIFLKLLIIHSTFNIHAKCNWPVLLITSSKSSLDVWDEELNISLQSHCFLAFCCSQELKVWRKCLSYCCAPCNHGHCYGTFCYSFSNLRKFPLN